MKITRSVVPSLFTVLNLFCGFLSILHTAKEEYTLAAWFILIAAVFDILDGLMARITRSFSDFGVEFDSLSDSVSFGVAPSFLVYEMHLYLYDSIGILISAMPLVCGAMRLARFNVQLVGYDKDYFRGLPIPSQAATISSFVLIYIPHGQNISETLEIALISMVVILSILMLSTFKYDTFPKFSRRSITQHPLRFTVAIAGLTAILLTRGNALFHFLLFYIVSGPLRYFFQYTKRLIRPPKQQTREEDSDVSSVDL